MDHNQKRELRNANLKVWDGATNVFTVRSSQDSSLKKNTAFIKRLRTAVSKPNVNTFLQEVSSLSLHKYLSEIISACYEGLCKLKTPADIAAGVEIISALHQRFGPAEFTGYLGWLVGRGLSTPDKSQLKTLAPEVREREEKDRLTRQRVLLRVATELWLAGVLRSLDDVTRPDFETKTKDSGKSSEPTAKAKSTAKVQAGEHDPFPLEVLKDLLGHDREHVNLPLVVIFVKTFAWDILGIKPRLEEVKKDADADAALDTDDSAISDPAIEAPEPIITSAELQQRFKNILLRYFDDVKDHIVRDQKTLLAQGRRNAEAYVRSGEVFEDRQANFDKQNKAQEKLMSNAQVLADVLGANMPDLKDKDESQVAGDGAIGLIRTGDYLRGHGDGSGIWEDEDERRFFENLIDVKDRVPVILLEDGKKKKVDGEDAGKKQDAKASVEEPVTEAKPLESDDQTTAIANRSVGAQVDGLLARLPDLHSKDGADQFSVDFCFVNSKASRNRLVKSLLDVPKGRVDLLPLYSRIIATLSKYMPDITTAIVSQLDEEFRSLQRRKSKEFLGAVRLLNIRYFAELTKFGIVPEHVIFHCFKVCLDDLNRTNVEILGNLMENCGRYLLRNPDTSPRMTSFLETLQRKKGAQHLEQREKLIIDNAIYYVNPPERPAIEQKDRTPVELFIQKLVYDDLGKRNVDKITKQIRKLHWEEPEVVVILEKVFTKPWKIRYNNVHLLAVMLGSLYRYHAQFAIACIDELLARITNGLEFNDVKFNQRRIAQVKYLGELYVYRMVDSGLIFDTMYKILRFGHEGGTPRLDYENPWDMPNDWFRIRLICVLLETCASFFDKGPVRKKLDFFIAFFQYYINVKDPSPADIEFAIQDAFAIISADLKVVDNYEDALRQFTEAVQQNWQANGTEKMPTELEDMDDASSSDGDEEDEVAEEQDKSSGDEIEPAEAAEDTDSDTASEDEEEPGVFSRQENERDPELDADFDRELAKMMAESMDSRKLERKMLFDVPLPMRRKERDLASDEFNENTFSSPAGGMKFSLLSKRGNRQQTRDIELPVDSTFAVAMRDHQHAEKLEQKRIKDIVLNLDLRDDSETVDGIFPYSPFAFALEPNLNLQRPVNDHHLRFRKTDTTDRDSAMSCSLLPSISVSAAALIPIKEQEPLSLSNKICAYKAPQVADKNNNNPPNPYLQPRVDKAGKGRANQRGRQLQVSDIDWT